MVSPVSSGEHSPVAQDLVNGVVDVDAKHRSPSSGITM